MQHSLTDRLISLVWIGVCVYTIYYFDVLNLIMKNFYTASMQVALACYAICIYECIKVIFVIPKQKKVAQINPDNYEKYAKSEIQTASAAAVIAYFSITIALFNELHIITPLLIILYFIGIINLLKWSPI